MTSVQLALQASARGASSVTLITRHKLCARTLNCEARRCPGYPCMHDLCRTGLSFCTLLEVGFDVCVGTAGLMWAGVAVVV